MALQIRSEIKQTSAVERELSIVIPGSEVAKALDRAYRELGQKVRLKGFRPGKVPRYVLEQYYKQDTEQQVRDRIVAQSFREAVKAHSIEPVANPQIKGAVELIPGMDFSYSAKVEVKPSIEIKEWKGLEVTKVIYEVTDDDVQMELDQIRERHAKVGPVENRDTVQQGDLVETNWSGTVDGEPVKGLSGLSYIIEIGGGTFPFKEVEQALVGKKVGDVVTAEALVPGDYRIAAVRGKTASFTINILGIKVKTLPALDDELAKDVSDEIETLEQLKTKLRESLHSLAKAKGETETKEALITALIEKNPFEVPQSLIERQAEQIAIEKLSRLPQQQAEAIWQARHVQLKEDARPQATRSVRISLILEELVKREGVVVSEADIEAHFEKVAQELGSNVKAVRNAYKKGRRLDDLKLQLSTSRMLDRVLEEANAKEEKRLLKSARG